MRDIFAFFALTACLAVAQAANSPQDAHQALDNAWWPGPLLALSANTLPRGHVLIEPSSSGSATRGQPKAAVPTF